MEKNPFTSDNSQPVNGMIDISSKGKIKRTAIASGEIYLTHQSIVSIKKKSNPKGDVLENAKLSAILAIKKTSELVLLAHPIYLTSAKVNFEIFENNIKCIVQVSAHERTGVEIEALAGVMNALLAIFDLCKRYEKDTNGQYNSAYISDIKVISKLKETQN